MTFQQTDTTSIIEAIDLGLDNFGKGVKDVVYYKWNKSENMNKSDIVNRPQEFESFLESMFGPGSSTVEKSIIRSIAQVFAIQQTIHLADAIRQARARIYQGDGTV